MKRPVISLKNRVRYEGKVQTFDRRPTQGADLEKIPNRIWFTISRVLHSNFRKPLLGVRSTSSVFKGRSL